LIKPFKIRAKPTEPQKEWFTPIYDEEDLTYDEETLVKDLPQNGVIVVNSEYGSYGDPDRTAVVCRSLNQEATDKAFNEKLIQYQKELEKYNKWYETNKDKIEEELQRQQDQARIDRGSKRDKEKAQLLKAMEDIHKKLAKYE